MFSEPTPRKRLPIRVVLTVWYTSILLVATLLLTSFLYYRLNRDLTKQHDRVLRTYAVDLSANMVDNSAADYVSVLDQELLGFRPFPVEYRIFDGTGQLLYTTGGWAKLANPPLSGLSEVPAVFSMHYLASSSYPYRVAAHSIHLPDGRSFVAQTALSTKWIVKTLTNYTQNMALFCVPLLLIGIAGGWWLSGRALSPVVRMACQARSISPQFHRRINIRGAHDELDTLATALNDMLDQMEEAFSRIERFSMELAHELRTPITHLTGETEAALMSRADEETLRIVLAKHAETYRRMQSMLNDILTLMRSGTNEAREERQIFDLRQVLQETVDTFRAVAQEQGISLAQTQAEALELVCVPSEIRRMVGNLLDNAIRHTTQGGRIELTLERVGESVRIRVRDTGCGIPEEHLPRIFQRFYRIPQTATTNPGFGLGLSIVRQIARNHSGRASIESTVGVGTAVTIVIPLHQQSRSPRKGSPDVREPRAST